MVGDRKIFEVMTSILPKGTHECEYILKIEKNIIK